MYVWFLVLPGRDLSGGNYRPIDLLLSLTTQILSASVLSPAYYAQFFTHCAFEQCSKNVPIMLNIMPMTTEIMPHFVYNFMTRLA